MTIYSIKRPSTYVLHPFYIYPAGFNHPSRHTFEDLFLSAAPQDVLGWRGPIHIGRKVFLPQMPRYER